MKAIVIYDIVRNENNVLNSSVTIYDTNYVEIFNSKNVLDDESKKSLFTFTSFLSSLKFLVSKDISDVILLHNIDSDSIQNNLLKLIKTIFNFNSFRLINKTTM